MHGGFCTTFKHAIVFKKYYICDFTFQAAQQAAHHVTSRDDVNNYIIWTGGVTRNITILSSKANTSRAGFCHQIFGKFLIHVPDFLYGATKL